MTRTPLRRFSYYWRYRNGEIQNGSLQAESRQDFLEKLNEWNIDAVTHDLPATYWENDKELNI